MVCLPVGDQLALLLRAGLPFQLLDDVVADKNGVSLAECEAVRLCCNPVGAEDCGEEHVRVNKKFVTEVKKIPRKQWNPSH